MARGRKKKETVERVIKFTAGEFKKSIEEAARLKDQASSYAGFHGEHVKRFTEKTGFSRQAYAFLLKLHRLNDPLKQQSMMDEVVMGFELLGFNDQGNLFDRVQDRMERDVSEEPEEEEDIRPPFMRNAVPLDEAEKTFGEKKVKPSKPKKDALSALSGREDLN